jgi:proline iminopeptidase
LPFELGSNGSINAHCASVRTRSRDMHRPSPTNHAQVGRHALVTDIEALRAHLGIDRWVVVGVSWGVTLGLVYAQAHPERVRAMVLGAVTSGSRRETEWITRDVGRIFPRQWEAFAAQVAAAERGGDLAAAYARLLADPDPAVREGAARVWCAWEDTHVSLMPGWAPSPWFTDPTFRSVFARLVTHYWSHGCFLTDGQVLAGMPRLVGIPGVLIHGRYDVSGPADVAWRLHPGVAGQRVRAARRCGPRRCQLHRPRHRRPERLPRTGNVGSAVELREGR